MNTKKVLILNIQVLLYFYLCENCLKISGFGIVKFTQNLWNVYDLFLLFMYAMY